MTNKRIPSPAEIADKAMQRIAFGVFLVSMALSLKVLKYFVGEETAILDYLGLGLGALVIIIVLPQFVKKLRLKAKMRASECEPEGFVADVYRRAAEKAFAFTFIFLLFMGYMTDNVWTDLPAKVAIDIATAVSLMLFSLSFFFFNRDDGAEDDDFDTEPGQ